MSDSDQDHMCLAALEPCGCTAWVSVLGYGHDGDAYKEAAREAKRGCQIAHMTVAAWKARDLYCDDHKATHGPPTWARVRKAMRAAEKAAGKPVEMGL
jgi:hypothetical protein